MTFVSTGMPAEPTGNQWNLQLTRIRYNYLSFQLKNNCDCDSCGVVTLRSGLVGFKFIQQTRHNGRVTVEPPLPWPGLGAAG